jgi:hypothetical protein
VQIWLQREFQILPSLHPSTHLERVGVQQDDPLGSALLCLGNHPCLVEVAQRLPAILATGYADNTFFLGPLQAATNTVSGFEAIFQNVNLQLSSS